MGPEYRVVALMATLAVPLSLFSQWLCVPTQAQRLARIEASEFYLAQIEAFADPDGGWDPDGGSDDDILGASGDDEALDELGA